MPYARIPRTEAAAPGRAQTQDAERAHAGRLSMQIAVKPEHDSDQCRRRRQKPPERDPVIPSFGGFDRRPTSGLKRPPMTPPADARNRRQLRRPVEARSASPIRRPQLHGRLSYQRTSSSEQSRLPRRGLPPTTTPLPLANPVAKSSLPLHAKPAELLTPEHGRNEESAGRSPGSTGSRPSTRRRAIRRGKKKLNGRFAVRRAKSTWF